MTPRIVLASASPRRSQLLSEAGIDFDIHPADVDESPRQGEEPIPYAERLALEKARVGSQLYPGRWALGADTVVILPNTHSQGETLAKPANEEDAVRMLGLLSGRTHDVVTAVALARTLPAALGDETIQFYVSSQVRFRPLSGPEILEYVATGEPMDKAGGYAIQGGAAGFVESFSGSWSNIVGLPLDETLSQIQSLR